VIAPQTQIEHRGQEQQIIGSVKVRELAQQEALERLIGLLTRAEGEPALVGHAPTHRWDDSLHRLARLRMARAAYALETNTDMVRVGQGAWICRHD
jgi:hypothetical protein